MRRRMRVSGGGAHAAASSTDAGFMSVADKQKLDGITPAAAPNPPLATAEEVAAGSGSDPRLLTPALIKQAVITHTPPPALDSIDNTTLANMSAGRFKGRAAGGGSGDPQDLTAAQARTILNVADGATAAGAVGDTHASLIGNPHQTSAYQIGAVPAAEKGVANGVATLDASGKVPAAQLPPGSGGAIDSVFGRCGPIVAQVGDYTAAQVGAIAVADKGDANGVCPLEGGKVPASFLPPGTTITTYAEFFGTDYINPTNAAAANDAGLDRLWRDVARNAADRKKVTFRGGGVYAVSQTISPSGKGYNLVQTSPTVDLTNNCVDPRIYFIEWGDTKFQFATGVATNYMEMRRGGGAGQTLDNFCPASAPSNPIPNDGFLYTGADFQAVRKRVAFNVRYQGSIKWSGRLTLEQNSRAADIWAIGSTGGLDADAPRDTGVSGWMWRGAEIDALWLHNWEGGIYAMHHTAAQVDSLTRCRIHRLDIAGGAFVAADGNTLDGCVINHLGGKVDGTTYIFGCPKFRVANSFLAINTPPTFTARSPIVIAKSQVDWDGYIHLNYGDKGGDSRAFACFHLGDSGRLKMNSYHQDTGAVYECGAAIYCGPDYAGHACDSQHVEIGSLSSNINFDASTNPVGQPQVNRAVVALDCRGSTPAQSGKNRQIVFRSFNDVFGPAQKWKPVIPYKPSGGWVATTNDMCQVNFSSGFQQFRFDGGAFTKVASPALPGGY